MDFNFYKKRKLTIIYMKEFLNSTFFKHLEVLSLDIDNCVNKLSVQNEIDKMCIEEYDFFSRTFDFFEDNVFDFKTPLVDTTTSLFNQDLFTIRFNFFMFQMQEYLPKEIVNTFFLNVYTQDINSKNKDELWRYFEDTKELKYRIKIMHTVLDYYLELEAIRTVIYILQNENSNLNNILESIKACPPYNDGNFDIFLEIVQSLLLAENSTKEIQLSYDAINFENECQFIDAFHAFNLEQKNLLNKETYNYLEDMPSIYKDKDYLALVEKIKGLLPNLTFDCILLDYSKTATSQFKNLKKGLEIGLELYAISLTIKKRFSGKKQRSLQYLLKIFKNKDATDLAIITTLYYFIEHNAHSSIFFVIPLSQFLAITPKEALKILHVFDIYKHESINYKKGKFKQHFEFLLGAYNANFNYLY